MSGDFLPKILAVAFGESALSSKKSAYKGFKLSSGGRGDGDDDARPRRGSTWTNGENVRAVKKIATENRRITIRDVADDVGISVGLWYTIFFQVTHQCLFVIRFLASWHRNHVLAAVHTSRGSLSLFPIPKTEKTHERT